MQHDPTLDIRLDRHGEPDVAYYHAKAQQLRGQAIAAGLRRLRGWALQAFNRPALVDTAYSDRPQRLVQSGWPWVDLIVQGSMPRGSGRA
jgi:hypothetical protein